MSTIDLTVTCRIHDGRAEDFVRAAESCVERVRRLDRGTRRYEWYLAADRRSAIVVETYDDSEAVLAHVANLGPAFDALLATCSLEIQVHGRPTPALMKALEPFPNQVFEPLTSL